MLTIAPPVNSPVMAKEADGIEQMNFRLSKGLATRVRRFCERHPFKPSLTRFAEIAFAEYLDQHEGELPGADPSPQRPAGKSKASGK